MENKKLYIVLGLAAVAGIAIWYFTKDKKEDESKVGVHGFKKSESKLNANGNDCGCGCKGEDKSNVQACAKPKVWNGWTCVDKLRKPSGKYE